MGPLTGLRVVEVTGFGPGPMAGMLLADQGADVIRIERPASSDVPIAIEPRFLLHNRGKRSLSLDLKQPEALATLLRLLDRSDAVIEGFRPGVAERLGFGPAVCRERNARLVYARVTGWGQTGPLAQRAGHDLNYIALAGVLDAIGPAGGPPVPPLNLVGDFGGGALYAVFGILAALHERQRSGEGQVVDVAMVEGALSLLTSAFGLEAAGLNAAPRGQNLLDGGAPFYGVFETADGRFVSLAPLEAGFFAIMLDALGLSRDWLQRRDDRACWPELREAIAAAIARETQDHWCAVLGSGDACFAPVRTLTETRTDPHLVARASTVVRDGVLQPAPAPRFDRTPPAPVAAVHAPGSDTDAILAELDMDTHRVVAPSRQTRHRD